jgi:hypothetical protein
MGQTLSQTDFIDLETRLAKAATIPAGLSFDLRGARPADSPGTMAGGQGFAPSRIIATEAVEPPVFKVECSLI